MTMPCGLMPPLLLPCLFGLLGACLATAQEPSTVAADADWLEASNSTTASWAVEDMPSSKSSGGTSELVLVASFMLLRIGVALRSLYEMSPGIVWYGVAFACFTHCIAEGATLPDNVAGVLELAKTGLLEFMHLYGLRTILKRHDGCS
mmetsp:Transcript_77849/g.166923  ORF Transcript_77849/g.166923 Transcript_77849/m.166923 type:complete len:148 (+) Transcript_77849:95-538(+)